MKRPELLLVALLLAVAAFVGVQIVSAPKRPIAVAPVEEDTTSAATSETGNGLSRVRRSTLPPPPTPDYVDIKPRLADANGVTYIDAILRQRNDYVARWVDRRDNPITVWVQPKASPNIRDFWPDFRDRVRDAFYTWAAAGVPLRFLFVDDSTSAEVRVRWVDKFSDQAAGKTYWARDQNWWIVDADIELAVHRSTGEAFDGQAVRVIALHEVGHLIGLDHSPNTEDVMSARVHVSGLSAADLRTASLIYKLPPGRVSPFVNGLPAP
jgi:hypothetical protein